MKESQARALEELAKKHRVTLENALNSAEKDKNRLLTVSICVHPIYLLFYLCGDDTQSITQWVPRSLAVLIKLLTLETFFTLKHSFEDVGNGKNVPALLV